MRKIRILTDSCADLTPEMMDRYGIDYGRMNTAYNGEVKIADLSWTAGEAHEFYDIIRGGGRITTTQVPPEEFDRVFRKYLDAGEDIIYISCSNKQSSSIYTAEKQAEALKSEYPEAEIRCVDSLHASLGEGLIAMKAAEFAAGGKSIDETVEYTNELIRTTNEFLTVHSLDYLKRAGRVKASAAFFGNLMGVKPIIIANTEGDQTPVTKVKGRLNSFKTIVALTKAARIADNEFADEIYIVHSDCQAAEIEQLCSLIKEEIGDVKITTALMGPIIGASCGPDAVSLFVIGKPIQNSI